MALTGMLHLVLHAVVPQAGRNRTRCCRGGSARCRPGANPGAPLESNG
jgi:hypothetical protein